MQEKKSRCINEPCIEMRRFFFFFFFFLYYTLEVRTGEYCGLGVFLLQYSPLVNILKLLCYYCINMNAVG